jgi:hypothetical protein
VAPQPETDTTVPVATLGDRWDDHRDDRGLLLVSSGSGDRSNAGEAALTPRHARLSGYRRTKGRRWPFLLAMVALVASVAALVAVVDLNQPGSAKQASPGSRLRVATKSLASSTTSTSPPVTTTTADPGTLPQTDQLPSGSTPAFQAEMAALWAGVVSDSVPAALPAFFPEAAYVQLKAIYSPQTDYADRGAAEFGLDLGAAHQILGSNPGSAGLVGVVVPQQYAHWVPPGTCENGVGYYEVANSRLVYEQDGQTRSFGIASMISWRGTWYVIHLGVVERSTNQGVVEDPEAGQGSSAPSSTC